MSCSLETEEIMNRYFQVSSESFEKFRNKNPAGALLHEKFYQRGKNGRKKIRCIFNFKSVVSKIQIKENDLKMAN